MKSGDYDWEREIGQRGLSSSRGAGSGVRVTDVGRSLGTDSAGTQSDHRDKDKPQPCASDVPVTLHRGLQSPVSPDPCLLQKSLEDVQVSVTLSDGETRFQIQNPNSGIKS